MSNEHSEISIRQCKLLNGWWDFQPVAHPDLTAQLCPETVPLSGWQEAKFLVPGFFTDHPYPPEWRLGRSGWMRTRFDVDEKKSGRRAFLTVDAAIPQAHIFINGRKILVQDDMFIGEAIDVTDELNIGANELAVFLTEFKTYAHPTSGKLCLIDAPWGCCISKDQAGIWQDVSLEWKSSVFIEDITIRTSVRENTITVIAILQNSGDTPFVGKLNHVVLENQTSVLSFPAIDFSIAKGETRRVEQTVSWSDYHLWSIDDPHLYLLNSYISEENGQVDAINTRFGFREVWIEKHRILLNGVPQRWQGEWCHKSHSHWLRPEYVRQWYRQLKDLNMNYVRMHTFPHPDYFLDIADEMGIIVCQESALHGSGQYGYDSPQLWERSREHARRMIKRFKNHPSLMLWSVENEMRWALNIVPSAKQELPKLRLHFNELDPTRPAYHDGDSSLWNETTQPIISRHYGAACHGLGWWDKQAPLHAGEVGRWHYASPYVGLQWRGDEVFTNYRLLAESLAADACRIIELARANEVSCLFIWNTSGLDNFRPAAQKQFTWENPQERYLKPLAHKPYESEYAWWEEGSGYRLGFGFEMLRNAFRPLTLVVREERTQFFRDFEVPHTISIINDYPKPIKGTLNITLEQQGRAIWKKEVTVDVPSGETTTIATKVPIAKLSATEAAIVSSIECGDKEDRVTRKIYCSDRSVLNKSLSLPAVGILGESAIEPWLIGHGISPVKLKNEDSLDVKKIPLVIIAEHWVKPGKSQNVQIGDFVRSGGRVLLLEQNYSLFPNLPIERQPVEMAHIRDSQHPVVSGVQADLLRFFGDEPFGLPSSDSVVTMYPYQKPMKEQVVKPILDSSGGDFSKGGLTWMPMFEARIGAGLLIASQLRLVDRWRDIPVAETLFQNILSYLVAAHATMEKTIGADEQLQAKLSACETLSSLAIASNETPQKFMHVFGQVNQSSTIQEMSGHISAGNTMMVWEITEATRGYWEEVIGKKIEIFTPDQDVFHLIADSWNKLMAGISNEDTCWLDNWSYRGVDIKEKIVDTLLYIEGAENLLRNAPASGLDILYGMGNATEWKRTVALSSLFDNPLPRIGAGLARVQIGSGQVIFCQIKWRPELWQFRRFLSLFLWNSGLSTATDILAGELTATAGHASDGYPVKVRMATSVDESDLNELLSRCKPCAESYAGNIVFAEWPGWESMLDTPKGLVKLITKSVIQPTLLGFEVNSPEPRKFMETVGGLPNPDLQTFLRLDGVGSLQAWINGKYWDNVELTEDRSGYIADIDFNAGSNFVVLRWTHGANADSLALTFENKERHPECDFGFK